MKLNANLIVGVLLIVIVILFGVIIFRKPQVITVTEDDQNYRYKIDSLATANKKLLEDLNIKRVEIDSLNNVKSKVKHIYHDQINLVSTADSKQLDSIIRANWD